METSEGAAILAAVTILVYPSSVSDQCPLNETFSVPSGPSSSSLQLISTSRPILFGIDQIIGFFVVSPTTNQVQIYLLVQMLAFTSNQLICHLIQFQFHL